MKVTEMRSQEASAPKKPKFKPKMEAIPGRSGTKVDTSRSEISYASEIKSIQLVILPKSFVWSGKSSKTFSSDRCARDGLKSSCSPAYAFNKVLQRYAA